ncbi:MAG TPA: 23S rRNA (guanosine(2251)-2'-O)-methyltransferase RlmB [Rhizomicrobium sp.]|nr:23S rRNA (guanosine(2251)-2'-O)-methyltransferase RlmB [Rhizomicrobium sp.]
MAPERRKPKHQFHARPHQPSPGLWLYGLHAVRAALENPVRKVHRLVLTEREAEELGKKALARVRHEIASMDAIGKLLPPGAVHQGVALNCDKLPSRALEDVLPPAAGKRRVVLILDQITDPHNAGAILRSAAAFGVDAVVVQDRHAPPESGVLAKAASGALDVVPIATVVNIARTLELLGQQEFWRVALAGDGDLPLREAISPGDMALVLGSEGSGVRRLVRERCDTSAAIPIASATESLNVSNAAAVALYEIKR